jgi:hypothetical protein
MYFKLNQEENDMKKKRANRGGDAGTTGDGVAHVPTPLTEDQKQVLQVVREADAEERVSVRHREDRKILTRAQSGWIPQTLTEWDNLRAVAHSIENPAPIHDPDEPGGLAEPHDHAMNVDITEMCFRAAYSQILSCRQTLAHAQQPRPVPVDLSDSDDYLVAETRSRQEDLSRFHPGGVRAPVEEPTWSTRESPEVIARLQENLGVVEHKVAELVLEHPWIAFRLGVGPNPTVRSTRSTEPAPRRHVPTDRSVKKARERHRERGIPMYPPWAASQSVMYTDVVQDIGLRPKGKTLDRIVTKKGYVPGNIRWATYPEQRDNQDRNPTPKKRR